VNQWHRLQILVTKEQLAWLKRKSYTEARSIGQIIRKLLAEAMKTKTGGEHDAGT